jgi:flagellar protein FlgJ
MKTIAMALGIMCLGLAANAATYTPTPVPNSQFGSSYKGSLKIPNTGQSKDDERYEKTLEKTKDLEAVLVSVMIEPMFPHGKDSGLYGGGESSEIYRSMMIQQYGKVLSKSTNLGVAENIARKLTKQQGVLNNAE